jgi:hypothetical protein
MGFSVKFNWVLQIDTPNTIEAKEAYSFRKKGNRVFPIDIPIDLIDSDRNAVAKIKIIQFTNDSSFTFGEYTVIKVYTGMEKDVLSNYWKENQ